MADQFDAMMNKTCTIQKKDTGAARDAYNQPSSSLVSAEDGVPCRLSTLGGGREYRVDKNYAIGRYLVFMRPRTFEVSAHNFLVIDSIQYNIIDVKNPAGLNHHLEIVVEKVKP